MGGKIDLLQQSRKRELQIDIDHHYASKVYTTGSPITGTATFTPRKDTPFETLRISLAGLARVRRDDLDYPKIATHWFLRTDMSDAELVYPGSKVFRARESYTIPFHFIVPDRLTTNACNHKVDVGYVRSHHLCLPPSMGTWSKDDMSVASARVEYGIQVDIVTPSSKKGQNNTISNKHIINVIPYAAEEPPLNIMPLNIQYNMQKDKKIRKSLISPVDGRLTAVASQPRAVNLDADGQSASESTVHINLEFKAKGPGVCPPKIGTVSATLQAQTWSRQSPSLNFPNMGLLRDAYTNYTTILSKVPVEGSWETEPEDKETGADSTSHSATVQVPFSLPMAKRLWIPTFHNCLISRTYRMEVALEVGNTTLRFNVPVQIAMESLDFPLEAEVDGWTPDDFGVMEHAWPGWTGRYSYGDYGPRALRAVGGDVLPGYSA
ncbi:arrestin [Thelonectria olida]|uniref:Arrestin n=1 Tax=Thelonectria olida TaxID=1576542 RepID=A0A9P9AK13_9HYPO|nr:arrestin [Thelonectria olida]